MVLSYIPRLLHVFPTCPDPGSKYPPLLARCYSRYSLVNSTDIKTLIRKTFWCIGLRQLSKKALNIEWVFLVQRSLLYWLAPPSLSLSLSLPGSNSFFALLVRPGGFCGISDWILYSLGLLPDYARAKASFRFWNFAVNLNRHWGNVLYYITEGLSPSYYIRQTTSQVLTKYILNRRLWVIFKDYRKFNS